MNHSTNGPTLIKTILLLVALVWMGCNTPSEKPSVEPTPSEINVPFRADGQLEISRGDVVLASLTIEIAEDDSSRTRGLMQRDNLPDQSGMLFIFEGESQQGFWMGNTRMALDLIFIRSDGRVQSISKYIQPMRTETISSVGVAQYVLEVPAGYSDTIGLVENDLITWSR